MKTSLKCGFTSSKLYNSILIFFGILNISYVLFGFSLGWDFYFGLKVIAFYGVLLLLHGILRCRCYRYLSSFINKAVNTGVLLTLSFIIVIEAFMGVGAYYNRNESIDYALVLGAGIVDDRPSWELKYRLDKTIQYTTETPGIKKLVLCGGQGKGKQYTDAYVMEKYLLSHGIDQGMIIREELSMTTYENIKFAKKILEDIDQDPNIRVAIVSNDFHVFRARLIAHGLGLEAGGVSAGTPLYIIPSHHVREYFAIVKYLLIDRLL